MTGVLELVNKHSSGDLRKQNCYYHQGTYAWGICSRCGRDLCCDCFLYYERKGFCPGCKRRFLFGIHRLKSYLLNPVSILILAIGLFSILYLAVRGEKINIINKPSWEGGLAKEDITLRNWLYLGKAVRLKLYADHLNDVDRAGLAKHSYYRARLALEQVLEGTQEEFRVSIADARIADESVSQRLAELLISIAACYRGEEEPSSAIRTLNKSLEVNPGAETAGLTYYNLGQIYEEDINDYHKAISMYKASQESALRPMDLLENMLDFLAKPVNEKRVAAAVHQLAGSYNPAEAQFRAINCYRKLGMADQVTGEYKLLISQYPFSEWAINAQKAVGPEEVKRETEIKKEKESIKIVPLKE
jgi:tetratricopeptide (TPR) repeat protein